MDNVTVRVEDLMRESGVRFGTSGVRGLENDMTDMVCYTFTAAFIQHLEEKGELEQGEIIAVSGDLRPSTGRITGAVTRAVEDRGYIAEYCGTIPSPALAYYGISEKVPTVMVTGSHIPEDRNGIKYTRKGGEILKDDEAGIKKQRVVLPPDLFNEKGDILMEIRLPELTSEAADMYLARYLKFFPQDCLRGKRVGVYQHSAVGRDLIVSILTGLGADVTPLGRSDKFVPVDTEAIRPEDVESARKWADMYDFNSIVSTDGDSDRPLISDENGRWLRGDVAGILCAAYLRADTVVTPVSCNTAVEKCGLFKNVIRTKIGSPFVIEGMHKALETGDEIVVGYEANGGFLLASDIMLEGEIIKALPTRDAVILLIAILLLSREKKISELLLDLPQRYTASNRLRDFPAERSREKIAELFSGESGEDNKALESNFGQHFGPVASVDTTDGLRVTFKTGEVLHLRPSGNAPEFRCYNEADSELRAIEMNMVCLKIMETWRSDKG